MRIADYIANRLFQLGCEHVFMVTGGAAMHLNDAFAQKEGFNIHCLHHEQSCSMAAEAFSRITGNPAIVNITAGPGSINAINGVFGAYVDSIPMIVISGQAKRETLVRNTNLPKLRQLGDQEVDIERMVSGVCKYIKCIQNPLSIVDELDKAFSIAISGRPGPVWLDIPIDIQASNLNIDINNDKNIQYKNISQMLENNPIATDYQIECIAKKLLESRRPVFYIGNGVRISKSLSELYQFLKNFAIPTVTGWNSNDLLWDDHPCYCGRPGTVGNRTGNFAVQFSDCVITIGCRLNIRQVSYNWNSFAKNAWKCHIDIDKEELDKPTLKTDLKVHASIQGIFPRLLLTLKKLISDPNYSFTESDWSNWRLWLKSALKKYPVLKKNRVLSQDSVNPYQLINDLTQQLHDGDHIICSDGTACVVGFQSAIIKQGQRLFHNSGCASMGYELPASIGAHYATNGEIICIAGDGSIMMNLQELSIIGAMKLPIKIFLLNNSGYHSIRQTQNNYFPGNQIGCGFDSGLVFPDFSKVSCAFGLDYHYTSSDISINNDIKKSLQNDGPILHEFKIDLDQQFAPKLSSKKLADGSMVSSELEDMFPFLGSDEMEKIQSQVFSL